MVKNLFPFGIGCLVSLILYISIGWWGFLVIFPWIGFSITTGCFIISLAKGDKKLLGRKIAILMIFPSLFLFVPIVNNENFQLEGIVLLISTGFFSKGFIHYAVAKLLGPLIWGRGFCGWACWTAAILEWLPVKGDKKEIKPSLKYLRGISLAISIALPLILVFALNYDVKNDYLNRAEMYWMFAGNSLYYLLAIPLAFIFKDKRAFCKILCPVSIVMMVPARFKRIKIKPSGNKCIECGKCSTICPMGISVMEYIKTGRAITHPECINCDDCSVVCPVGAIA